MEDVAGVARIVKEAMPSFVELKGMTFSGQGCLLSMENCPWYSEVAVTGKMTRRWCSLERNSTNCWTTTRSLVNMNIAARFF